MEYYGDIYATVKLRMRVQIEADEEPSADEILAALQGDDAENSVEIIDIVDDEIIEHISIDDIDIHESSTNDYDDEDENDE